jgi:hypothetical protein
MAHVIRSVRPDGLTFDEVAARFAEGMLRQGNGALLPAMLDHFHWRGIDPRPFLAFVPHLRAAAGPRRARRPPASRFHVHLTPWRGACACHPGGFMRAGALIRASHATHR